MFKKLKDKIAEEVKQSPLKSVQQLAQAVVSPSSSSVFEPSSSNDKFCIEEGDIEEDVKQEQPKPGGFTSVTLTGQTASPVRDQSQKYGFRSSSGSLMVEADNLFPKFEPQPTNYHVQSDWESASEVEDRYSQLEHINKESLYEAYRKVYNRYNKMKNKYHEIVTHYRQLEREKEKAKTVLTETQDKALLRISELREQCLLEQQAKAHLEEALRNELEERDHIINTLRTKVQYLKGVGDSSKSECSEKSHLREEGNLIDFTENSSVSTVPLPFDASSSADKINWFEEKLKVLKTTVNEETQKLEQLKCKLEETRKQSGEFEDASLKSVDNSQPSLLEQENEEFIKSMVHLIAKLFTEVQYLQKSAIQCSLLNSSDNKPNLEPRISEIEKTSENSNAQSVTDNKMDRYSALIKQLEEQNEALSQKLKDEVFSAKELKNELNCLKTTTDLLKSKINLSNENFGKNDAMNCLITNVENELIYEWNLCFQNFLQTRCEVTVLKDSKNDLEKELLRIKEETKRLENKNKEITEQNNKFKGDLETLQKDLKDYQAQIETLAKEKSDLKINNENFVQQIKKIEKSVLHYQNLYSERNDCLQKVIDEKNTEETKRSNLEIELENYKSNYHLLLDSKQKMDVEISSLRKENNDIITEKEFLNNKVNEMENKIKLVEDDYKVVLDTRDELENQINSLTKLNEELASEKNIVLAKITSLKEDMEKNKTDNLLLLKEKDNLLHELRLIKDERDTLSKEKLSITEKLDNLAKELESNKLNYSNSLAVSQEHSNEMDVLREERDKLTKENCILETKVKTLNQAIDRFELRSSELEIIKGNISEELSSVTQDRDKLLSEIKLQKNVIAELDLALKAVNEELSILKEEHADLSLNKNEMQTELQRLQECLKSNTENQSSFSEVNLKLSEELSSLKVERENLLCDKSTLETESQILNHKFLANKEELAKLTEEYTKLSTQLENLQGDHANLLINKKTEEDNMEEIKSHLKEKEDSLLSVNQINQQLSEEIKILKSNLSKTEEELGSLNDRHNSIVTDHETNKELVLSLTKMKEGLYDQISCLKKDCEGCNENLKQTKQQLEKEENINYELKNQLCSLSESFKVKCEETNEKYQENISLKSEMDKLMDKVNVLNSCIEKLTKEKNVILNYLLANFNNVKIIKELQKNLYDFVKQFQDEIYKDIKNINHIMGHSFLEHLHDLINPEKNGLKFFESDCKSKEDIDSYNSKLKNFHDLSNMQEEVLQVNVRGLQNAFPMENEPDVSSNMVAFKQMGHLEKLSKQDSCNSFEPEAYLKQAISLMKSFTNLLNHNSVNSDYSVDFFTPNNEKYIKLNDSEGKNLQKEIAVMESFITDFEDKYHDSNFSRSESQELDGSESKNSNSTELQLHKEIGLKDDIIKKLQSVIEEYDQKKEIDDSEFLYKQKVQTLEQENNSLTEKLQKLQETHELNIKNIISEYENKLEEVEEESNLYDFEKLGKEKKHVVNEMKEQIQNLQQDLEERGDAFEKLYEEHQQSVTSFDEKIHQLRSNHDKELREQDKKWRQCLDRRLAEEETRHQHELASLNMQWNAERRELETARRLAMNAVESGSGSNELLRRQVQALTVQLAEMRNNRCEACDRKRKSEAGEDLRSSSIQDCTEMEYLRNILYEYMMGKEPLVLAKVLCALVKFDENQTKEVVSKEEHRITLFGQLGLL